MAGRTKRVHLTRTMIDALEKPAKGKAFLWDDDPPGLGVVITSNGVKSYIMDYTIREGVRRRLVLDRCDRTGIEQVRIDARKKLSSVDVGTDPVEERKAARRREKMGDLLDDYIEIEMPDRKRASTINLHKKQIEKYIRPALGSMAIVDVSDEDVAKLQRNVAKQAAQGGKGGQQVREARSPPTASSRSCRPS